MQDLAAALAFLAVGQLSGALGELDKRELLCLADNVYHEARGESVDGQVAIAQVTRNRLLDAAFPNSYCDVVYQAAQFSWTARAQVRRHDPEAWRGAVEVASAVLLDLVDDNTDGATHFYNPANGAPVWHQALRKVKRIGNHLFFRDG